MEVFRESSQTHREDQGTGEGYWKQARWRPSSEKAKVPRQGSQRSTLFFGEGRAHKIRRWEPDVPQAVLPAAKKVPDPEEREQEAKQLTRGQLTCTHTNLLNNIIPLIPCVSQLPTAGRLPHCIRSWQCITGDQWVLQAVRGYKLDLISPPVQGAPPLASGTGKQT